MPFFDVDFGKFLQDTTEFAKDLDLEDVATIATTGVALSTLFQDTPEQSAVDSIRSSGDALREGALISQSFQKAPEVELGGKSEELDVNRRATQSNLRVARTSTTGASTGLSSNPLGISL